MLMELLGICLEIGPLKEKAGSKAPLAGAKSDLER